MGEAEARWQRVREIFDLAADASPDRWLEIVSHEAGTDQALRADVLRLLTAFQENNIDFDHVRVDAGERSDGGERIGATIANYRLTRLLGQGGMGAVYEAVRADGAFDHRVAVKLVRSSRGGLELAERFRRERQILAALEHRNIARLLDGGTTDEGEPYFVMEYVEGVPITTYCNAHHLGVQERLRLFRQVLAAVEHAHGKLIVHRDLKPANVLVAQDGSVKLLDFGVAKLLGAQDGEELTTVTANRPFTPEYASPEQLRDEPVSAASDVYALGVVLFELLSGRRPYDAPSRSPVAVLRAVESDRPLPRVVASAELDSILRKALRPDVATRYRSVAQLDDDIRRFLSGLPVLAQPDSFPYRAGKFIRRNVAAVVASSAVILGLIAAVVLMFIQGRRAAADRAWQSTIATVTTFEEAGGVELVYGRLARSDTAFERADALCQTWPDRARSTPVCTKVTLDLGTNAFWHGDMTLADALMTQAIARARAAPGTNQATIAGMVTALAEERDAAGDLVGAERLYREASNLFAEAGANLSAERLGMLGNFALCLERQGRLAEADSLVQIELLYVAAPAAGILLHAAAIHAEENRIDLARAEEQRGEPAARIIIDDTMTLHHVKMGEVVGALRLRIGDVDGAIAQLRGVLTIAEHRYPADDPRVAEIQDALGEALVAGHQPALARPLFEVALATFEKRYGAAHPQTVAAKRDMGLVR